MRNFFLIFLLFGLLLTVTGRDKKVKPGNEKVAIDYLNGSFNLYDKMQKQIWCTPELGFLEKQSSHALQKHLAENGFSIEKGVAGMPKAFTVTFGRNVPVIGSLQNIINISSL